MYPILHIIKTVTIFGSAIGNGGERDFDMAFLTAQLLAENGLKVVDGGGPGIMYAGIKGAQEAGGKTAAVYLEPDYATAIRGREKTIKADKMYSEKNYIDRTKRLMELGDAYVFFNGGTGTISEFAMCWVVARLYFGFHKPLILFGKFWRNIIEAFVQNMNIKPEEVRVLRIVEKPSEVLSALEDFEDMIEEDRKVHIQHPGKERHLMLGY
ncbi:MAG: LOG family protein [Patescibacteria group bacterium]